MFIWDPEKNAQNLRDHHISFEDAISVFGWPTLEEYDGREDYGEDRWILTGLMRGQVVVVVVYTERGDIIRLISARKAKTYERENYEAYLRSL